MKKIILILGTLGFAGLMGCMYEPTPPAVNMIQKPADLAAESISISVYTDPTTGKSRPVIVGIVRNVGETRSSANRTVKLIATTTVNGNPITEELANSVVPSLSPGDAFQIIGNPPQSHNPTTQYTLSVSPGDNNPANDLFILNPSSPPRY